MVRSGVEPPTFRFSGGLASPGVSTTGRLTRPYDVLAVRGVQYQPDVSTAVVSKALARSGGVRTVGPARVGEWHGMSRTPVAIGPAPHRPPDGFAPESVLMSGYLRPVTSSVSVQGGCCGGNLAR